MLFVMVAKLIRQDYVATITKELEEVDLEELSQDIFYEVY